MQIYSNYQNINIIANTLTITDNIVVQTNSINIYADKIFITYSNKNNKEKVIDIYGNPAIFYQFEKNRQMLATSSHISYKIYDDIIILKGKVYLKKENHILQSNCIKYKIKKKHITTCNNHNDFNKTIFTINVNKNHTNIHNLPTSSQSNQKNK